MLQKELKPLLGKLSKTEMEEHLTTFTSFHTRYYKVRRYGAKVRDAINALTVTISLTGAVNLASGC